MAAELFYLPFPTAFTSNGLPAAGAKLYFYYSGTTTPAPTYTDSGLSVPHPHPVVANGVGRLPNIYLNDAIGDLRMVIKDKAGTTLQDTDPYIPGEINPGDISFDSVSGLATVGNRALLAALPTTGGTAFLSEAGREGVFVWSSSNLSAQVTADTGQGVYVAPASDTDGSSGAWVRKYAGPVKISWFGPSANGVTDDAPKINYALTLGDVELTPGATYGVGITIRVPSDTELNGRGATVKMLATFSTATSSGFFFNATVALSPNGSRQTVRNLTIDSNKVGLGGASGDRKNGIMMMNAADFVIDRVTAKNCSGYIFFGQGSGSTYSSGRLTHCRAINGEYHYEFMQCEDILMEHCQSSDGDGDITCNAFIHPVYGGSGTLSPRRIHVDHFYGKGRAFNGVYHLILNADSEIMTIDNSHMELDGSGGGLSNAVLAFVPTGTGRFSGIKLSNSTFISNGGAGSGAFNGVAVNCRFKGIASSAIDVTGKVTMEFVNCTIECVAGTAVARGILSTDFDADARVSFIGGSISVSSSTAEHYAAGPGNIYISRETKLAGSLATTPDAVHGQAGFGGTSDLNLVGGMQIDIVRTNAAAGQSAVLSSDPWVYLPAGGRFDIINATDDGGGANTLTFTAPGIPIRLPAGKTAAIAPWGRATVQKLPNSDLMLTGDLV